MLLQNVYVSVAVSHFIWNICSAGEYVARIKVTYNTDARTAGKIRSDENCISYCIVVRAYPPKRSTERPLNNWLIKFVGSIRSGRRIPEWLIDVRTLHEYTKRDFLFRSPCSACNRNETAWYKRGLVSASRSSYGVFQSSSIAENVRGSLFHRANKPRSIVPRKLSKIPAEFRTVWQTSAMWDR